MSDTTELVSCPRPNGRQGQRPVRSPAANWSRPPRRLDAATVHQGVPEGLRRSGARPGRRLRRQERRRQGRAARTGRCADCHQGYDRHQGHRDHRRLEDPRRLGAAVRRHRHREAQGRRHAAARQDQPRRIRAGLLDRALRLPDHAQPVGTPSACPVAPVVAPLPRSRHSKPRSPSAPTLVARFASPAP